MSATPRLAPAVDAGEALLLNVVAERAGMRPDLRERLYAALYEQWCREATVVVDVADLLAEGATELQIEALLGLTRGQVRDAVGKLERVVCRFRLAD